MIYLTKLCFSSQTTEDIITKDYYNFIWSTNNHWTPFYVSGSMPEITWVIATLHHLREQVSISLWKDSKKLNMQELYISENVSTPQRKSAWVHVWHRRPREGNLQFYPLIIINTVIFSIEQTHHHSVLCYWASTVCWEHKKEDKILFLRSSKSSYAHEVIYHCFGL